MTIQKCCRWCLSVVIALGFSGCVTQRAQDYKVVASHYCVDDCVNFVSRYPQSRGASIIRNSINEKFDRVRAANIRTVLCDIVNAEKDCSLSLKDPARHCVISTNEMETIDIVREVFGKCGVRVVTDSSQAWDAKLSGILTFYQYSQDYAPVMKNSGLKVGPSQALRAGSAMDGIFTIALPDGTAYIRILSDQSFPPGSASKILSAQRMKKDLLTPVADQIAKEITGKADPWQTTIKGYKSSVNAKGQYEPLKRNIDWQINTLWKRP